MRLRKSVASAFHSTSPNIDALKGDGQIRDLIETLEVEPRAALRFRRRQRDGFYVVRGGLLKLQVLRPTARIIRLCTAGDWAGFGSWLAPDTMAYVLTAVRRSTVEFWPMEAIARAKALEPTFSEIIIQNLISALLHKDERIAILETHSAEKRLALLLLWLAKKFGIASDGGVLVDIALDREDYAQLCGASPVTIARAVTSLEDKGFIRRKRRKILICDSDALGSVANGRKAGRTRA